MQGANRFVEHAPSAARAWLGIQIASRGSSAGEFDWEGHAISTIASRPFQDLPDAAEVWAERLLAAFAAQPSARVFCPLQTGCRGLSRE